MRGPCLGEADDARHRGGAGEHRSMRSRRARGAAAIKAPRRPSPPLAQATAAGRPNQRRAHRQSVYGP